MGKDWGGEKEEGREGKGREGKSEIWKGRKGRRRRTEKMGKENLASTFIFKKSVPMVTVAVTTTHDEIQSDVRVHNTLTNQ